MTDSSKYPLHDKMKSLSVERDTVNDFIDWLSASGFWICELGENDRFYPTMKGNGTIIANYFGIDLKAWDAEKDLLLEEIRGRMDSNG